MVPTEPATGGPNEEPRETNAPAGVLGGAVQPDGEEQVNILLAKNEGHYLMFLYDCTFDPKTGEIEVVADRSGMKHWNVTAYVLPPNCNDCVKMQVIHVDFANKIYDVNVTLKNPTQLTAYDARGILLIGNPADTRELVNADNYTMLFDDSDPADINPFKAFRIADPKRAFPPGISDTVMYSVKFPTPSNFNVKYVVDISWPGNAKEPYDIANQTVDGDLDTVGTAEAEISCDVLDWQDDVESVKLDISVLSGSPGEVEMVQEEGTLWDITLTNTFGAAAGIYTLPIIAKSMNNEILLFDYVDVEVVEASNHPPIWLMGQIGIIGVEAGDGYVKVKYGTALDPDVPITYNIYCSPENPVDFETVEPASTPNPSPYTCNGLENGKVYYFAVRAMDGKGLEDSNTNQLSATPQVINEPPQWVDTEGITATGAGPYQVSVFYGEAIDTDEPVTYTVYYDIGLLFDWETAKKSEGNPGSPTLIKGLENGKLYLFGVRARDGLGLEDANMETLGAMPVNLQPVWDAFPPGIQNAVAGDGEVSVIFGTATDPDSLGGSVSYNVYYSTELIKSEEDIQLAGAKLSQPGSPVVISPLPNDIPFYFVVRAMDEFGLEDTNLNNRMATPENQPPVWDGPAGVQNLIPGNGKITVEYGVATDKDTPVTYTVYYSLSDLDFWDVAFKLEDQTGSPSVIEGLFNDLEYFVGVRAQDSKGKEEKNIFILSATPSYDNQPPTWDTTVGVQEIIGGDKYVSVIYGTASDPDIPVTYVVYYSETSPVDFIKAHKVPDPDGSPTIVSPLDNGDIYHFAVRAKDSLGLEDNNTVELPGAAVNQPPVWVDTVGITDVQANDEYALVYFGTANDPSPPVTYNVYWDDESPINFATCDSIKGKTTSPVFVSDLTNGETYWFAVRAQDGEGLEDTNTNELSGTPQEQPPIWDSTVGIQGAIPDDKKVTVTYGTASDPDMPVTYNVYYSETSPINFSTANKLEAQPGSPTVVTNLTNGQKYFFAVRARDATGMEDNNTIELSATPSYNNQPPQWDIPPGGITDATAGDHKVTVKYGTASDTDLPVTYNVYWSETTPINFATAYKKIGQLGSPTVVDNLVNDIPYYFAVRAMDGLGAEENNTFERSATPKNKPPAWDDTVGITDAVAGDQQVTVYYGTASDPDLPVTYTVYYSDHSPFIFPTAWKIEGETGSPTVVGGLTNDIPYYFAVRARDGEGLEDSNVVILSATPETGNTPPVWIGPAGVQIVIPLSQAVQVIYGTATDPDLPVTYRVYYDTTPINWSSSPYITDDSSPTTVSDLNNAYVYFFGVRAVDGLGLEDTNTKTVQMCPNLPPEWEGQAGIIDAIPMLGKAKITFGTANDVDGVSYNIYYSKTSPINFGTATKITGITGSPYIVSPLDYGDTYHFAVRAVDDLALEEKNTNEASTVIWRLPSTKWLQSTGSPILSSPNRLDVNSDSKEEILIGGQDGDMKALNVDNGMPVWSYPVGNIIDSSPCLADVNGGVLDVVFGSNDHDVYAVDGVTGDYIWSFPTAGAVTSSPASGDVDNDGDVDVAFGSYDNSVYVVDAASGTEVWHLPGGNQFKSSPALYDVTGDSKLEVFIGCTDGKMYCFNGTGAAEVWHYTTSAAINSSPAIGDVDGDGNKECVFVSNDGYLYVLNATTGAYKWDFNLGSASLASPALGDVNEDGGVDIAIGAAGGIMRLINGKTHLLLWSTPLTAQIDSPAALADLTGDGVLDVIVGTNNSVLYCLDGTNGAQAFSYNALGSIQTAPLIYDIDDNGLLEIVFGVATGTIYALDTDTPTPATADIIWPKFHRTTNNRGVL